MFLLRLKTEFSENLKLIIAFWAILAVIVWSFFDWWNGFLTDQGGAIGPLALLVAGLLVLILIGTMFKRDDLKDPHEFWNTRPIRAWTLFGTKFVLAILTIVLPVGVLMTVIGLTAGVGITAVGHGLEAILWTSFATFLLGLSAIAYPGGNRAFFVVCGFFGGVILTSIFLASDFADRLLHSYYLDISHVKSNILLVFIILTVWFIWQCLRQIRNKHLNQRPALIFAIGIISVLVIGLVPLPRVIQDSSTLKSTTTLPKVTKAKLLTGEMNHGGMYVGTKYGSKFVSMDIDLLTEQRLMGDAIIYSDFDLTVTGVTGVPQSVEMSDITIEAPMHSSRTIEATPKIQYSVFDSDPNFNNGGSSSGSIGESMKLVEALPRKKVRIQGAIRLIRVNYKTILSRSLANPFETRKDHLKIAYINKTNPETNHDNSVICKSYSPPLVSSMPTRYIEPIRFRIEHPDTAKMDWFEKLNGGSASNTEFFGSYRNFGLRISDREIESNYYFNKLRENGYTKTGKEWKQEAKLICESEDESHAYIMPIDIEVEVPDPVKLQELMLKGEL